MGINPIEYRPWKGERTAQNLRFYVIARSIIRHKVRSLGVIALLVLGFLLVHTQYLIMIVLVSHESLTASDMNTYLGSGFFAIFAMLLAAVVTSDLIAEDLASNSFVLYFSRALKIRDYLVGKTRWRAGRDESPVRYSPGHRRFRVDGDPDRQRLLGQPRDPG